jgi:fermentation-respiration switch protein FrsA (DUF1100 family)
MVAVLGHPHVHDALFHPRHDDNGFIRQGASFVTIEIDSDVSLGGRLYPTGDPESPLFLYYHGNGEIAADYGDIEQFYNQLGISLLIIDYRGYGTSSGVPTSESLVSDARTVSDKLDLLFAEFELQPCQFYVMGRSLGSVPAIETALYASDRLAGLVIESGFSATFGLLERLGVRISGAVEARDGFDNAAKMERVTTRTLVIHGKNDVLIPPSDGQELYDRCASLEKRLVLIPGAGHNDIMITGMYLYFNAIRSFVHCCNR